MPALYSGIAVQQLCVCVSVSVYPFSRITNKIVLKPGFSGVGTRIEMRNWREPTSDHLAPKMEFWGQNRIEIEHFFLPAGLS